MQEPQIIYKQFRRCENRISLACKDCPYEPLEFPCCRDKLKREVLTLLTAQNSIIQQLKNIQSEVKEQDGTNNSETAGKN